MPPRRIARIPVRDVEIMVDRNQYDRPNLYSKGDASRAKIPERQRITEDSAITYFPANGRYTFLRALIAAISVEENQAALVSLVASAVQTCTDNNINMIGHTATPTRITVLDATGEHIAYTPYDIPQSDGSNVVGQKLTLSGSLFVTKEDIDDLGQASEHEMFGYIGVLLLAAVKEPTNENYTAFTDNRWKAIASRADRPKFLFNSGSVYTALEVYQRVHKAFNTYGNRRANLVLSTAALQRLRAEGFTGTFFMMFKLLEDFGFGQLVLIKYALATGKWTRHEFPEMKAERRAFVQAVRAIMAAPETDRPFLKAAYGDQFVPAEPGSMSQLLGMAKAVMGHYDPRWRKFGGGKITDRQLAIIEEKLSGAKSDEEDTDDEQEVTP